MVIPSSSFILESDTHNDVSYVLNEFRESFSQYLTNWGKLGSHYGLGGNQRTTVQLFGQLDDIELHLKFRTPSLSLSQPSSSRFNILASMCTFVFPICSALYAISTAITPCGT
jgi:hypothetical protein